MKITTWNVNSLRVRLEAVVRWASESQTDVLCLQETKTVDATFPSEALAQAGFVHQLYTGQKTYNGVAIVSRLPLSDPQLGFRGGEDDPQRRLLAATIAGVRIYCCYVPNGKRVGCPDFDYKLAWLERLRGQLLADCSPSDEVVVCGDFNIAPDDASVWDPFELEGHLLFTADERDALQSLLDWGLHDAYRVKQPFSSAFTWWDYRAAGFARNKGLRIDHHLVSASVLTRCERVQIWRELRGWEQPSDHVPVELVLAGS